MNIRRSVVAGRFYPESKYGAIAAVEECLVGGVDESDLPGKILGGIVPHAGWMCSGAVAGKVFSAIHARGEVETFVLFGAVHHYGVSRSAVFAEGKWETPLGSIEIDKELAKKILSIELNLIMENVRVHLPEHSIEVQVPFIQKLFPRAKIVPILVPPFEGAEAVGRVAAEAICAVRPGAGCIGSSDLTHYGPGYGFTPHGSGLKGISWAKDVNDQGLIDLIMNMDAGKVLHYAESNHAACGAGAITATIGAVKAMNATKAKLLVHTNSYEVLHKQYGDMGGDAVGYAGIVFGAD